MATSGMNKIPPCTQTSPRYTDIKENYLTPIWEKAFCLDNVASLTWQQFLGAKQNTTNPCNHKVQHWDDSGVEEAFYAAKKRYFARTSGLPYTTGGPLMDPDMFVDEIKLDEDEKLRIRQVEKEDEEADYHYYSRLLEQVRLLQASELRSIPIVLI